MEMEPEVKRPEMEPEVKRSSSSLKNRIIVAALVVSILIIIILVIVIIMFREGVMDENEDSIKAVTRAICHVRPNPSVKLDATVRSENNIQVGGMAGRQMPFSSIRNPRVSPGDI